MVYIALGVEVLFSVLISLIIRNLSQETNQLNVISPIGASISLAVLLTAQVLRMFLKIFPPQNQQKTLVKDLISTKRVPYVWIFFYACIFVFTEVLGVYTLQLGAPLTEREFVQRLTIVFVILFLGKLIFSDSLNTYGIIGVVLSFIPVCLVLVITKTDWNFGSWVPVSLVLGLSVGIKRIGVRSIVQKLTHYETLNYSGILTLIGFFIVGYFFPPSFEFISSNILILILMMSVVPFITISRQVIARSGLNTTLHDCIAYIGVVTLLTFEKIITKSSGTLDLKLTIVSILISMIATYFLVHNAKAKKE